MRLSLKATPEILVVRRYCFEGGRWINHMTVRFFGESEHPADVGRDAENLEDFSDDA